MWIPDLGLGGNGGSSGEVVIGGRESVLGTGVVGEVVVLAAGGGYIVGRHVVIIR